jgi:hypothetical protein
MFIVTIVITITNRSWVGCLKRQLKVFLHCRYRDLYLDLQDRPGLFGDLHLLFVFLDGLLGWIPQALLQEAQSYGVFGRAPVGISAGILDLLCPLSYPYGA